ncbi:MAG: gamma-glutamyltransferase [Hyphomicrobium sp.]
MPRAKQYLAAHFAFALVFATGLNLRVAVAQDVRPAPEAATEQETKDAAAASRHMAAAADPRAAAAARDMLRKGGSAIDAAIAAQLVLGLVEPQSSGLGGGAFIVHWDAVVRQAKTYDARETAPAAVKPDRFIRDGKRMTFADAVGSGLSVGVPGVVRGMELAHRAHGKLPWRTLFEPAIKLAEGGFEVTRRLSQLLSSQGAESFAPAARAYFFDAVGAARPPGYTLKNPDYAATLSAIAGGGSAAFYEGRIAVAIVDAVEAAPIAKGDMTHADISAYVAKEREPLCFTYRVRKICGMGPPSSGGLAVAQILKLIEPIEAATSHSSAMSAPALHVIAEAEKLAYADRNRYVADTDFVPLPDGLLDDIYIAARRSEINVSRAMPPPSAGTPFTLLKHAYGEDATVEAAGTSHISIVDDVGNAVAMTTTIENGFGSRLWAAGFLLNNELTDFSFDSVDKDGRAIANRPESGKRPRSSMSPTIVIDGDGRVEAVTGSPGGSRIIMYVVKSLVAMLDWRLSPQVAADLPNFGSEGAAFYIEPSSGSIWPALALKGYGHAIRAEPMTSGLHTIVRRSGVLLGGADPRREGAALGD